MSIMRPNMVQQENRLRTVPDEALRDMLLRMAQTNAVGSPEYILVAGEMQARKNTRQQAAAGQPQEPPVIAELLTGVGLPNMAAQQAPQMPPQLPEDSGLGAMAAPNMEMMDAPQYAGGGIVAFSAGDSVARAPVSRTGLSPEDIEANRLREQIRRRYAFTASPLGAISQQSPVFTPVGTTETRPFHEKRRGLQDLLKALPNLNKEQLQQLDIELQKMDQKPPPQTARQIAQQDIGFGPGKFAPAYGPQDVAGASDVQIPGVAETAPPPAPEKEPPAGLAAIAAPRPFDEVFEMARKYAKGMGPAAETLPSVTDAVAQQKQAMQEAGFDFNLIKDQIAEVRAEKEQSKEDRKEAVNLRLLEAGLGIMAGESPHAFVNIGKGATPALKGLSDDIKEIKKIDRERDKAMRDLATADNQIAAGMGLSAIRSRESAMERIARSDESRATREANIAQIITSSDTQRYVADQGVASARETRASSQLATRENTALKQAQDQIQKELVMNPALATDPAAYTRRLTQLYNQNLSLLLNEKRDTETDLSGWGTPRVKK
jgi:hypothetical protein